MLEALYLRCVTVILGVPVPDERSAVVAPHHLRLPYGVGHSHHQRLQIRLHHTVEHHGLRRVFFSSSRLDLEHLQQLAGAAGVLANLLHSLRALSQLPPHSCHRRSHPTLSRVQRHGATL